MVVQNDDYKTLEIMLTGTNNRTLKGILNFTSGDLGDYKDEEEIYDSKGAATFVVVVILVYGLSIVLMIGSLAKKNMKVKDVDLEEKQIHRYLSQANDLKEKGAKENYRQLKRNIMTLVNQVPEAKAANAEPSNDDSAHNMGHDMIRSMLAVGSPSAAQLALQKSTVTSSGCTNDPTSHKKVNRLISETDSLQALLEEDEEGDVIMEATPSPTIKGPPRVEVRPAPSPSRHSVVSHTVSKQPETSLAGSTPSVPVHPSIVDGLRRSKSAIEGLPPSPPVATGKSIPTVVISGPEGVTKNNRFRPLDIGSGKTTNRLSSLEQDSKIICNVDGSQPGKSCKLSMDSAGNIWILQDSPLLTGRAQDGPPSPSISPYGSLGYESLGKSQTPSPGTRSPSPAVPPVGSYRSRKDRAHSPTFDITSQRERSRSPRNLHDRSRSPTPQSPPNSCCEHKHGIIPTTAANMLPSGRKSPYHEHTEQVAYRNDMTGPRNDVLVPSSIPMPHSRQSSASISTQHLTDEEELVQITTV